MFFVAENIQQTIYGTSNMASSAPPMTLFTLRISTKKYLHFTWICYYDRHTDRDLLIFLLYISSIHIINWVLLYCIFYYILCNVTPQFITVWTFFDYDIFSSLLSLWYNMQSFSLLPIYVLKGRRYRDSIELDDISRTAFTTARNLYLSLL